MSALNKSEKNNELILKAIIDIENSKTWASMGEIKEKTKLSESVITKSLSSLIKENLVSPLLDGNNERYQSKSSRIIRRQTSDFLTGKLLIRGFKENPFRNSDEKQLKNNLVLACVEDSSELKSHLVSNKETLQSIFDDYFTGKHDIRQRKLPFCIIS